MLEYSCIKHGLFTTFSSFYNFTEIGNFQLLDFLHLIRARLLTIVEIYLCNLFVLLLLL